MNDPVNHPPHYKAANGMEAIDVIEGFGLGHDFHLGNSVKYLLRAGRKGPMAEDLRKAAWYINRKLSNMARRYIGGMPAETDLTQFSLCYLATPYTKYPAGIESAFVDASAIAARLLEAKVRVYSPISHCHPLSVHGGINPLDHSIWIPFDQAMMDAADALIVAHMVGWQESYGVTHEIKEFTAAGKPIFDLDPDTLTVTKRGGSAP